MSRWLERLWVLRWVERVVVGRRGARGGVGRAHADLIKTFWPPSGGGTTSKQELGERERRVE